MQKLLLYFLLGVVLLITILFFGTNLLDPFTLEKPYKAKVENIEYGNNIILSNGKVVLLAGVFIPYKGTNYRPELINNIKDLLIGKTITVKEILKYRGKGEGYPRYPLVEAYFEDGTMVNVKLLEEGMALFDQGYYKNREKYENIEREARKNKKGIWGSKNPPVVVYIGSKKWRYIHYPECPEVQKITDIDKIEYYFLPEQIFGAKAFAYDCKYREAIEKTKGIDEATHDHMQP